MKHIICILLFLLLEISVLARPAGHKISIEDINVLKALAERGDADSMVELGIEYHFGGRKVPKDRRLAFRWFNKAALQGNAEGQYWLARAYEYSYGVKKDLPRAYYWMSIAAVVGDEYEIKQYLEAAKKLSTKLTPAQKANMDKVAKNWLAKHKAKKTVRDIIDKATEAEDIETIRMLELALKTEMEKANPDPETVSHIRELLGIVCSISGRLEYAVWHYQRDLDLMIDREGEYNEDVAIRYNKLGKLYRNMHEYDQALAHYDTSLRIWFLLMDPDNLRAGFGIGITKTPTEMPDALERMERVAMRYHVNAAATYHGIARTYQSMGKYDKALEFLKKSLAIYKKRKGEDHPEVATSYFQTGFVYIYKGEYDKAMEYYRKALAIRLEKLGPDHSKVAESYFNIAHANSMMGKLGKGLEYYRKALAIFLKNYGPNSLLVVRTNKNMAEVYKLQGEHEKTLKHLQAALAGCLNLPEHGVYLRRGLYHNIGYVQLDLKNPIAALAAARKARVTANKFLAYLFSFAPERNRLNYQQGNDPYSLFAKLGSAPDLAEAVLRNKGIVLSSLLEDRLAAQASSNPQLMELLVKLRMAARTINKLETENPKDTSERGWRAHRIRLDEARNEAEQLQKLLTRMANGYGQTRQSLSLTPKDVQGRLAKDGVLLEYITYAHYQGKGQRETHVGVIILPREGEPKWVPLGSAKEIDKLVNQYQVETPKKEGLSDSDYEPILRELYDKLMAPIVKELPKDTKTLILSPDGDLNFLSFATLLTEKDRFLCEDYTIKYVSTGRDLVPDKQTNHPKGSLVVFANPTYDEAPVQLASANGVALTLRSLDRDELRSSQKFSPLPGTQKEADYLNGKAKDWKLNPEVYTGKAATEAVVSSVRSPRILHLATHGFFQTEEKAKNDPRGKRLMMSLGNDQQKYRGSIRNPMHRSGLAFAGAQKTLDAWTKDETPPTENDGILTAAEASVLNLKGTWLVTLSACETGQGEARSGEGVLGLRRAFIQAGAQNLLMTLWKVSDKYTVPFMKEFYEKAIASGDAPTAMAEVQKEMLLKIRNNKLLKELGLSTTRLAVQWYGPFVMSFQGTAK